MRDLYQDVTNRVISALEAGTPPWVRPWSTADQRPRNAGTERIYRGINYVLLALQAMAKGYAENRWLTYKQAIDLGGHVRGGEQGTTVIFYKLKEIPEADGKSTETRSFPILRSFTVFNLAQIGALPDSITRPPTAATWVPYAEVESLLQTLSANVLHGSPYAYYDKGQDAVHLPYQGSFPEKSGYYATVLHEISHWTGHAKRLNRDLKGRYGDSAYAMEELIAEMGSAFMCAQFRIDGRLQHPAYLSFWLDVLKKDKRAIFNAAAKAQEAADYLLGTAAPEQAREAA